jgi:hypothetical protein
MDIHSRKQGRFDPGCFVIPDDSPDTDSPMSLGNCEHPEDVAIHEELHRLSTQIFDKYYPILLRRHRCPTEDHNCQRCNQKPKSWIRCSDCFATTPMCVDCILATHQQNPFHRIEKWCLERKCWVGTSLSQLGLCLRILHEDGSHCKNPGVPVQMQAMHINGVHDLRFHRCSCTVSSSSSRSLTPQQCLANRLYPATTERPAQAYTFDALELFHKLNMKAFTNIKQFCDTMADFTTRPEHNKVA